MLHGPLILESVLFGVVYATRWFCTYTPQKNAQRRSWCVFCLPKTKTPKRRRGERPTETRQRRGGGMVVGGQWQDHNRTTTRQRQDRDKAEAGQRRDSNRTETRQQHNNKTETETDTESSAMPVPGVAATPPTALNLPGTRGILPYQYLCVRVPGRFRLVHIARPIHPMLKKPISKNTSHLGP